MKLNESLAHLDMKDKITPLLSLDEFKSQIGEDSDIIVITFIADSSMVAEDLVNWLERGYDFVLDAETSPGEVLDKKYYVFAEINRRSSAVFRIMEIINDLYTLTGLKSDEWQVKLYDEKYPLNEKILKEKLPLSPSEYQKMMDSDLNEMREIAGLKTSKLYDDTDNELKALQRQAGIK